MKKSIIIWVVAALLVGVAIYTTINNNVKPNTAVVPPSTGNQTEQPAPTPTTPGSSQSGGSQTDDKINLMENFDFTLEDLEGNKVTLSELKGKKVFLNFWATWCPPCKAEMPDIEKLYQETKDTDLIIIAVNVGEDKNTVQNFITKNKYNFKILLDVKGEVSNLYQVSGIPTSYFIDTDGYMDDAVTGGIPYESMKEYVDKLK